MLKGFGRRPSTTDDPTFGFVFCLVAISGKSGGTELPGVNQPMYLLRFSKAEYHSQTLRNEELRFTPLEAWRRLEGLDLARGDAWEGADRIDQPEHVKSVKIRFGSDSFQDWIEHELAGPIITRNDRNEYPATHGLCFNIVDRQTLADAFEKSSGTIDFNRFCYQFGPSLLVVTDISKFLELTIAAIKGAFPQEVEASSHGPVKYVEDSHHGQYSIYCKPARFGWQKEFRVMLYAPRSNGNPLILPVPGLNGVCQFIGDLEPNATIVQDEFGKPALSFSSKQ